MSRRPAPHRITFSTLLGLLALLAITWSGTARAQTFTQGTVDGFAAPTEPVAPSPGMQAYIAAHYLYPGSRDFDDSSIDRWFATTFDSLRDRGPICGAALWMIVSKQSFNDSMGMMFIGPTGTPLATGWDASLSSLGLTTNTTGIISLNLASLPGGVNLIPTLNAQGFVDIFVQDDSAVDFIALDVTPCATVAYTDVYTKDNSNDFGSAPTVDPIWGSPDIRVAWSPGSLARPYLLYGYTNYLYVTLRNNGPLAPVGNAADGALNIYYTRAGVAALWPNDWTLIGSIPVAYLAPGATQEFMLPWSTLPAPGHYSLLTRWVSPRDPMTLPEWPGSNTLTNTRWNNNIAWKDIDAAVP